MTLINVVFLIKKDMWNVVLNLNYVNIIVNIKIEGSICKVRTRLLICTKFNTKHPETLLCACIKP